VTHGLEEYTELAITKLLIKTSSKITTIAECVVG
jgi:hypothetical protein